MEENNKRMSNSKKNKLKKVIFNPILINIILFVLTSVVAEKCAEYAYKSKEKIIYIPYKYQGEGLSMNENWYESTIASLRVKSVALLVGTTIIALYSIIGIAFDIKKAKEVKTTTLIWVIESIIILIVNGLQILYCANYIPPC